MTNSTPVLRIEGAALAFGSQPLFTGLNLELAPAEHLLMVGRSGCGKTSLLRAIAGLQRLDAGRISLHGSLATDAGTLAISPERRGIGYLFQGGALWPHLTVEGTLRFCLKCGRVPRKEHQGRIAELLEWVELSGFEKRRPGSLSGGEAQRVGLARALCMRPKLMLLDEPLGPLDAELRYSLLDRLESLRDQLGFATLHVTHDPREAARIAHRALRLEGGVLQPLDLEGSELSPLQPAIR